MTTRLSSSTVARLAHEGPGHDDCSPGWSTGLPVLHNAIVTLRDLRPSDAPALAGMLNTEVVARFIARPPSTAEGFDRFIRCMVAERAVGRCVCYAIVPNGLVDPAGVIQIRKLGPSFDTSEWGWALGSPFWGTGVFMEAAHLALPFAFDTLGVRRLEARATVTNGRGNGVLRKLGAAREGILRQALRRDNEYLDQALWTILANDWRAARQVNTRLR